MLVSVSEDAMREVCKVCMGVYFLCGVHTQSEIGDNSVSTIYIVREFS